MKLLIATKNKGKASEIEEVLSGLGIEVLSLLDYNFDLPPEIGLTFEENAIQKARYAFNETGLPTLADDSGLEVDALGGKPGIYSARFAAPIATDKENNSKLQYEIRRTPPEERTARFKCALAFVDGKIEQTFEGTIEGLIIDKPRGENGFGYDPYFLLPDKGLTTAEIEPEVKNKISHRGQALDKFIGWFKENCL